MVILPPKEHKYRESDKNKKIIQCNFIDFLHGGCFGASV